MANYGWWQANRFDRKQRKRARWLIGYTCAPVLVRPDFRRGIPKWQLTDPLCTYPAPMLDSEDICPIDAIHAFKRTVGWLGECYPDKARGLELGKDPNPDDEVEILEYVDGAEYVLAAVGRPAEAVPSNSWGGMPARQPGLPFVELERYPNRVGRCTLIYPSRPSLDRPTSQFDDMPGLYRMQARAMALWLISAERAIFPDTWFVSHPQETVNVIQVADGRAGIPGEVKGGQPVSISQGPPPQTATIIDTMERNQRVTASLSPDLGGENPTNVRTGRAGEQLLSASVDYWVQEAQETLGLSYQEENSLAVAVAKNYFGNESKSFYVNWKGSRGPVDYVPNTHFENDNNIVSWPHAGSDVNSLIIGLGQRLGLDEISVHTAQELDPYIDDAEEERRRLSVQSVDKAFMAAIDQQVAGGQVGGLELARFGQLVLGGKDKYEAWQTVHEEAQAKQAAQAAPPGAEGGPPGPGGAGPAPGSPDAMPGLAAPGQQAALGMPGPGPAAGVSAPAPGVDHMAQLLSALKQPAKAG
jgi:hypothetical protein